MRSFDRGFTVLEMLVAAGIAVLIMTLALVALTTTTRAQNRSRMLIIEAEEARSALMRIRRDIEGWFDAADDGSDFVIVHDAANNTDTLQLICATANRGPSDHVRVRYYVPQVETGSNFQCLIREILPWPFTGAPEAQVIARNVRRARFESNGASPPEWVTVTLTMKREEMSTMERERFISGGGEASELYEIRWYEETVNVPASQ